MSGILAIDLGTSSVKAVVISESGQLLGTGTEEYPIDSPRPGWAEQEPEAWWAATTQAVQQATTRAAVPIRAIGLSGQMHGTVLVAADSQPVGPAIIWADQRSTREVAEFTALIGSDRLARIAGTAPATGFMGSTLLWLKHRDPGRLDQAEACLLPKDYLRLRLTGHIATEPSDASSTALFDVRQRRWSDEIIEALGLPGHLLPPLLDSTEVAGTLTKAAAEALHLPAGLPVVAGCADQVAQAVGNGLLEPGNGSVTLGSGGQLFVPLASPVPDDQLRLHLFCHAPADRWYLLGAMLTAGLSFRWFRDLLGLTGTADAYHRLSSQAAGSPPGANGLIFLPYLVGERSPLMDPLARGCFIGLTLQHERGHLARAIMEGVAFALRQILETMLALGAPLNQLVAAGNGLSSPVWRQIVADVLARPLYRLADPERSGAGAAMIAGIGAKIYGGYEDLQRLLPAPSETTEPMVAHIDFYERRYRQFCQLYPALKPFFHNFEEGATVAT